MNEARPKTDGELLSAYARGASSGAFAALVERHGAMVHATCSRMLGHHDAEDAAQAVFLLLARKARGLRGRIDLTAWLHRAAWYVARNARRERARRAAREKEAAEMRSGDEATGDTWKEISPRLDEAVESLARRYREVVTICYLEGRTQAEAAGLLGKPEGTVASLRARALEKLRGKLIRKGVVVTAAVLGTTLAAKGASAAALPAGLAASVEAVLTGTVSAGKAVLLAEGAARAMLWSKMKLWAAALATVAAACVSTSHVTRRLRDREAVPSGQQVDGSAASPSGAKQDKVTRALSADRNGAPRDERSADDRLQGNDLWQALLRADKAHLTYRREHERRVKYSDVRAKLRGLLRECLERAQGLRALHRQGLISQAEVDIIVRHFEEALLPPKPQVLYSGPDAGRRMMKAIHERTVKHLEGYLPYLESLAAERQCSDWTGQRVLRTLRSDVDAIREEPAGSQRIRSLVDRANTALAALERKHGTRAE